MGIKLFNEMKKLIYFLLIVIFFINKNTTSQSGWFIQSTAYQLYGVCFKSAANGTAVGGSGTIVHTTNGGTNWIIQNNSGSTLNGVSFVNDIIGTAVGVGGTILHTTNGGTTFVERDLRYTAEVPTSFLLRQNYPNPFNSTTVIQFGIPSSMFVSLRIYNVLGQVVSTVLNEEKPRGMYSIRWHANVASGVYFYRLEAQSTEDPTKTFISTRKMQLLR